jgi:TRAP transporter TAXI family solute receptor
MRAVCRTFLLAALALVLAACSSGPDESQLERDVQTRMDTLFGRQVLTLETLRRQGSAPYRAADDGAKQVIVYYNATLRFAEVYDPSDWQGLSPTMLANALGAADEGITGLKAGPNQPDTELRAYGSVVYRRDGKAWQPAGVAAPLPTAAAAPGAAPPESQSDELVRRLTDLVQKAHVRRGTDDAVIAEELSRALDNIRLRTGDGSEAILIAAGPEGGEYWRFLSSVVARMGASAPMTVAASAGSVENALMINRGDARVGVVQSDVAAAAVTGVGRFAGTGPLQHLRAAASLFPEPLHVVVRADSDIASLQDLAGRRVALGALSSGSRQTAERLLEVAGVDVRGLEEAEAQSPQNALDRLVNGEIDAVVEVVSAPWRQLEIAMRAAPLRLVPLDLQSRVQLSQRVPGLFPLTLAARTYPGQDEPVPTVAATALLVARDDVPDALVTDTLDLLYASAASGGAGVQATRLSKSRARDGVNIPMHPAAARYFAAVESAPSPQTVPPTLPAAP